MKKKINVAQIIRHIIQAVAFVLFPGLFITAFTTVRDVCVAIIGGSFHFYEYADQLMLLMAVFPITALFGRFFCGYLCSFGSMGDLLWRVSGKLMKKPLPINAKTDGVLKWLKYIILLLNVAFVWTMAAPLDSTYSLWNVFGVYSTPSGWTDWKPLMSVGGLLLLLIIAGDFLIERFFCRYICPLGAIFTMLSRFRLHRIRKPMDECGSCQLCTRKCSMGIPLKEVNVVKSGECIDCYQCVDVCPKNNVVAAPAPAVAGTVAAIGISGIYYAGTLAAPMFYMNKDSVVAEESADGQAAYKDGVYTGKGSGFRGNTSVEVTVENGLITGITVISTDDDRQFFDRASNRIISQIISTQSLGVDAVSGATFSSNGIIEAVADALNIEDSGSDSDVGLENGESVDSTESREEEDNDSSDSGLKKEEASGNGDGGEESSGDSSPQSGNNPMAELDLGQIADGSYSGKGIGFRGEISVTVRVENHSIAGITIESHQDDRQFFDRAQDTLISEIISGQNLNVDTVSGATFSSNGIIEAVADALNVVYSNPNGEKQLGGNKRDGQEREGHGRGGQGRGGHGRGWHGGQQ